MTTPDRVELIGTLIIFASFVGCAPDHDWATQESYRLRADYAENSLNRCEDKLKESSAEKLVTKYEFSSCMLKLPVGDNAKMSILNSTFIGTSDFDHKSIREEVLKTVSEKCPDTTIITDVSGSIVTVKNGAQP